MPTAPSRPSSPPNPGTAVLHGVIDGVHDTASQHPWLVVLLVALLIPGLVRSARVAMHTGPRDPVRRFTRADKQLLLTYAGNRCEHHGPFGHRCRATDRLEADHVHPHSRGGWTHLSNGQILCKAHNREKNAAIPWNRSLRRLAERRGSYYPESVERAVVRRRPRRAAAPETAA